ncbi:ribonuclease P protein subunit p20-like [Penaeus japonicus]|uniref:ribonuclease P protein subunit p20-like n=1 Tax=Penaeus japonicus TaxID=27405 RepID=UPI001C713940|nr:ribonuclease P protein subunit p20-like [Penaeus japonicus]XP_042856782.1 ribonuclease P protein subunit p20-like [Penaeus japonicus]
MATETKERASKGSNNDTIDPDEQWLRRRLPRHLPKRNNDVYVNNYSNFKGQEVRAVNLLHECGWVVVHGLGSAVPRAINLALSLQVAARAPTVVDTRTSTVYLTDDIEPTFDGADQEYHTKGNAAVHIKVSLTQNTTKEAATPEKSQATK